MELQCRIRGIEPLSSEHRNSGTPLSCPFDRIKQVHRTSLFLSLCRRESHHLYCLHHSCQITHRERQRTLVLNVEDYLWTYANELLDVMVREP